MKIYLASPFFKEEERIEKRKLISFLEKDFEIIDPEIINKDSKTPLEIYKKDIKGIEDSDVIVAIINTPDPGTMFEIGYAVVKKRIITFSNKQAVNNLMITESVFSSCNTYEKIVDSILNNTVYNDIKATFKEGNLYD